MKSRVRTPEQKVREYAAKKLRREQDPSVRKREAELAAQYRKKNPEAYKKAHAKYVRKNKGDGIGRIYFVQAKSGPIKIGHTTKTPQARLKELQVGNFEELRLLGAIPGTVPQERDLHRRFATQKIRGEWFQSNPELFYTITALCAQTCPLEQSVPN